MNTIMHLTIGLTICLILKLDRKKSFLFAVGSVLPDLDYIISVVTGINEFHHQLFHNIFFFDVLMILAIVFSAFNAYPYLCLGWIIHVIEDIISTSYWGLFYPFLDIKLGLEQTWLYSTEVSVAIIVMFFAVFAIRKKTHVKGYGKDKTNTIRITCLVVGTVSVFGALEMMFIGIFLIMLGYFIDDELIRRWWRNRLEVWT